MAAAGAVGSASRLSPAKDVVMMLDRVRFHGIATMSAGEASRATLMRELPHWTADISRDGRDLMHRFSAEADALDELVAKLGITAVPGPTMPNASPTGLARTRSTRRPSSPPPARRGRPWMIRGRWRRELT